MNNLLFDFTVDKATKTVSITREFDAELSLVWDAFTTKEILDQWWAPKPSRNQTKSMDFREGGMWLYAMISPENEIHWCKNDYHKIIHHSMFSGLDAFCDENGIVNTEMPDGSLNVFVLDKPDMGLYMPKLCWHTMQYSHNAVQLVVASSLYNEADYIRSYEDFKALQKNEI